MWEYVSEHPSMTQTVGRALAPLLQPGDVVSLSGHLGAGKTLLVKAVAAGLGIDPGEVTSPTFSFIHEYASSPPLYHFDVYRLQSPDQLEDLGYEEYFYGNGITLVEWGDVVASYLPPEHLAIELVKLDEHRRELVFSGSEDVCRRLIRPLKEALDH